MDTADVAEARGIASLPAMRELLAHNDKRASELLRIGLTGHYGSPGKDGTRLYLDIGAAKIYRFDRRKWGTSLEVEHIARTLQFGGIVYERRGGHPVGELGMSFRETKQGKLVVNAGTVKLDEHVRGRGFTGQLMFGLRDYFQRSGVDHVKITAGLTHGGRGWAGIFDWDPDHTDMNRLSMIFRINAVLPEVHPADRAMLLKLQDTFNGPPESWPSPRDLLRLEGRSQTVGEQILQGSVWRGKYIP